MRAAAVAAGKQREPNVHVVELQGPNAQVTVVKHNQRLYVFWHMHAAHTNSSVASFPSTGQTRGATCRDSNTHVCTDI